LPPSRYVEEGGCGGTGRRQRRPPAEGAGLDADGAVAVGVLYLALAGK